MKNQAVFSSKDKSKKLKCRLLQFLFGALRVKTVICSIIWTPKLTIINFRFVENIRYLGVQIFKHNRVYNIG